MKQNLSEIFVANTMATPIVVPVKRNGKWFRVMGLLAVAVLGAGCGGIQASKSISPLSFFLPGLTQHAAPAPRDSMPVSPASELLAQAD